MGVTDIGNAQSAQGAPPHEQCEHCGAPVEVTQRYCVVCGAHRRHVPDPAARHLAGVARSGRGPAGGTRAPRRRRSAGIATALVLAVIPLAIGCGVLIGRASTNGDDKLIAALRAQKPEIINTGGIGPAAAATSTTASAQAVVSLNSDFPLHSGYSVELLVLPGDGTDGAAVANAESAARLHGAPSVGLIAPHDFTVTPSPPAGAYVIYSGAFTTKAQAEHALAKLHSKFSAAKVIQVKPAGGAPGAGAGQVLAKSAYGTAHQIAGSAPTAAQVAAGGQVVQRIQKQSGKSYVNSQRGLPDQISVP